MCPAQPGQKGWDYWSCKLGIRSIIESGSGEIAVKELFQGMDFHSFEIYSLLAIPFWLWASIPDHFWTTHMDHWSPDQGQDRGISCNRVDLFVGIGLTRPLLELGWLKGLCRNRVDFVGIGLTSFVGIGLTLLELGWLGMVNFRVNPIPTKKGQICWNRVDSTFVGNGLTRVNFRVNPITTKMVKFVGIGFTRPLLGMGWPESMFKSTQFLTKVESIPTKRVIFVGFGLTGVC